MIQKLKNEVSQTLLLLRNVPALMVTLFVVSVIGMNVLAQQAIVNTSWLALDGGIFISWLSFLGMDTIVKRFGPKASIRISIFAILVNFVFFAIQQIVIAVGIGTGLIEKSICSFVLPWWILLASTAAFVFSAVVNAYINDGVGKLFKKNPNGKAAFVARTYISTFLGQFLDNLLFAFLCGFWASRVMEGFDGSLSFSMKPLLLPETGGFGWWGDNMVKTLPMTVLGMIMMSLTGAVAELLTEVVFSPVGYKTAKKWTEENIGIEYLIAEKEIDELKAQYKVDIKSTKDKLQRKLLKELFNEKFNKIINHKYAMGEVIK